MKTQVLKPGYLVSLKTALRGGVNYTRRTTLPERADGDTGGLVTAWETIRVIPDPAALEAAQTARSKARSIITGVCCASSFGLLCPLEKEADMIDAIAQARAIAEAHNAVTAAAQVDVYVLVGRIAHDDAEAARAIAGELRELLDAMRAGIAAANPEAIREAASKARAIGSMLDETVQGRVAEAIAEARRAARAIVKRVEKAGETAATVVAECNVAKIEAARFSFLDMEEGAQVTREAPAARGIDLDPEAPGGRVLAAPAAVLALEF